MRLSVVIPVYNKRNTLRIAVERVLAVPQEMELIW
jgi:glycosyltransferase involved in cell wall biosynthesis